MPRHRRFRRHRRGSAQVRKIISLGGKIIGGLVIGGPAIEAVSANLSNPGNIPRAMAFNYIGWDPGNPNAQLDVGRLTGGIASIAGGVILLKLFSWVARRF